MRGFSTCGAAATMLLTSAAEAAAFLTAGAARRFVDGATVADAPATPVEVPEPAVMMLVGIGLLALSAWHRRRRHAACPAFSALPYASSNRPDGR